MTSPTTSPLDEDQLSSSSHHNHTTPRQTNCTKRRETHPSPTRQTSLQFNNNNTNSEEGDMTSSRDYQNYNDGARNNDNTYNNSHEQDGPLTWKEARYRLKCTLEQWTKQQQQSNSDNTNTTSQLQPSAKKYQFLSLENLDILMAIVLCTTFVVLSFALPSSSLHKHDDDDLLPNSYLLMQRIAAILFLVSSLASAYILNRWATVREGDYSIERRRCVGAFLKEMEDTTAPAEDEGVITMNNDDGQQQKNIDYAMDIIPRKNNEDVYSAFRLNDTCTTRQHTDNNNSRSGQWHRIPSLLLVKGDHIALKIGDTSPAKCTSLPQETGKGKDKNNSSPIIVQAGERLSMETLGTDAKLLSRTGNKSTVTLKSEEDLLTLANGVQVFELLETPLESFLSKDTFVSRKPPQILRQGQAVRSVLCWLAFLTFLFTTVILLIRPSVGPSNFFSSRTWTIPILTALCFLPVTMPMFLFGLECIGTARILSTVHPWASNQKQTIDHGNLTNKDGGDDGEQNLGETATSRPSRWLLTRYIVATLQSRLKSSADIVSSSLLTIPPASMHLLEKLGLVTAIALIDDELACEPHSTPQQLLIPSKDGGLKILDLCPIFEDEYSTDDDEEPTNQLSSRSSSRRNNIEMESIDSDDDENEETKFAHSFSAPARRVSRKATERIKKQFKRRYKKSPSRAFWIGANKSDSQHQQYHGEDDDFDVQFEDPDWWQSLPSLKCIGLSCMLMEGDVTCSTKKNKETKVAFDVKPANQFSLTQEKKKLLVGHLCLDRERKQLSALARCIGFSTLPNKLGQRGDLSSFDVRRHLHIISSNLLWNRIDTDQHAMGLEESRNWSRLYTDADTVIVKDSRSRGDLVLTVGDARVVTTLCPDWWQGENATISPLTASDRQVIIDTQNNWMLSDLDVQAFSYAPLPYIADHKIGLGPEEEHIYLLDNGSNESNTGNSSGFWPSLIKNQIFLGLLGSNVRPRKEMEHLINASADAGVRFVYFSPRNMRRTKELASQMGIDVAWNCAISLRPLDSGEDDVYRMTSNYADWDVNARLPHGVEDVKRHLEEVDNVPLLVSLYTDVTKRTAAEMVSVFQEYHDTVLSIGLSHLPGNHEIFSRADIAIGVDVFAEDCFNHNMPNIKSNSLYPAEVSFIATISSHSSVFNLWGSHATCRLLEIIQVGRASLEAVTSSATFFLSGLLSFGIFILLCPCTVASVAPNIPALEAFLYVQVILHGIGLSISTTKGTNDQMTTVPPKNDVSTKHSFKNNRRWYLWLFLRSAPSSIISHMVYLMALGELMWELDPTFVEEYCDEGKPIIRCPNLVYYNGLPVLAAGSISLASLALCNTVLSASFLYRTEPVYKEPPWNRNPEWVGSVVVSLICIAAYLAASLERGTLSVLSWYFYLLFVAAPFICLSLSEMVKRAEQKHEKRAAKMRRLQFETRLGMWSPKESTHVAENTLTT